MRLYLEPSVLVKAFKVEENTAKMMDLIDFFNRKMGWRGFTSKWSLLEIASALRKDVKPEELISLNLDELRRHEILFCLGSAGHAMELKIGKHPDTHNLKIVLIEEDPGCYDHLKNVISRRWPSVSISDAEGPPNDNTSNVFLIKKTLAEALTTIGLIPNLGNAHFDPLRSVSFSVIEQVASNRIRSFLRIRALGALNQFFKFFYFLPS